MKNILKYLLLCCSALSLFGCEDYLDKTPQGDKTEEDVFTRFNETEQLINRLYFYVRAAAQPHRFVGINQAGQVALLQTQGNPDGHVILRGGKAPNYSPADVAQCEKEMEQAGLRPSLMVDCSHGNSNKDYRRQPAVAESVVAQIKDGNRSIIGLMIESNIHEGNQSSEQPRSEMKYGVSVTDACISWEMTDALLREIHQDLNGQLTARVA